MTVLLTILIALMLTSCGNSAPEPASQEALSVSRVLSQSPDGTHTLQLILEGPEKPDVTDSLTLTLLARYPADSTLQSTDLSEEKLTAFKVTPENPDSPAQLQPDGTMSAIRKFRLEPWIAESYSIPAVNAEFTDANGKKHTVTAPESSLEISQMPEEFWQSVNITSDLEPYRKLPLTAAQRKRLIIIIAGSAIAALILALLVVKWIRAYLQRRRLGPPPETPYQTALRRLDELAAMELMAKGEYKHYCIIISDILRQYIEGRFQLHAPRLTTQEFMEHLSTSGELLQKHRADLRKFMNACDMVKFAAVIPFDSETEELARLCRDFLNHTSQDTEENVPS